MAEQHQDVLLVDDDQEMLRLVSHMLTAAGYKVRTATSAAQAFLLVEDACPDFIITDWMMPEVDGPELCRKIRERNLPHYVHIVMLTGKSGSGSLIEGLNAGADDFMTKPVLRDELLARLQSGKRVLTLERQLSVTARTDPLTGIPTRRAFFEHFDREMVRSKRYGSPLSCAMIDADFFKRINDVYGHPAGDEVLVQLAGLLNRTHRACDFICRYGGEEFAVLLSETDESAAFAWAERFRSLLSEMPIEIPGKQLKMTASIGVAGLNGEVENPQQLLDLADQALLVAKESGRDRSIAYRSLADDEPLNLQLQGDPFTGVTARSVMSTLVACLSQQETIGQAAEFFLRFRIHSSPVIDEQGKLVGVLSEKDVVGLMTDAQCWNLPIKEVMKTSVVCYEEDTPLRKIYDFLSRVAIRRVMIVDNGYPTGIISRGTLLRWYRNWWQLAGAQQAGEGYGNRSLKSVQTSATAISEQAHLLSQELSGDDDPTPMLVGRVSRIQELLNDMLASSRDME